MEFGHEKLGVKWLDYLIKPLDLIRMWVSENQRQTS